MPGLEGWTKKRGGCHGALDRKKGILAVLLFVVCAAAAWLFFLYRLAGESKTIQPHFSGTCKTIGGLSGPEDITIHPTEAVAYIAAYDRKAVRAGGKGRGAIFAYDLKSDAAAPVDLTPDADEDFRPHGISLFAGRDGKDVLFVVNHQGGAHRIEVFDLRDGVLAHRESIASPLLVSPNDLAAVGPDTFYVTNDHGSRAEWTRKSEDYLRLRRSNVLYYDGSQFVEVASGIGYANGINVSPDRSRIYVCALTEGALRVYARDARSNRLTLQSVIPLGTGADNVEVDPETGDLWIGAHPKLLTFVKYSKGRRPVAPSQVLRLRETEPAKFDVEEVFLDTGEQISGSSVAAVRGARLLIGAVMDSKFLDCTF